MPRFPLRARPNGYLHLGHALSALINFDLARAARRPVPAAHRGHRHDALPAEFEAAIYEDLAWLGLAWEEPVRRQSEHLDDYRAALGRLDATGLIYPSFESRAEIARLVAAREATRAPGHAIPTARRSIRARRRRCRAERARAPHRAGEPYALRLDMAAALARDRAARTGTK